jgi:beta-glucosidase
MCGERGGEAIAEVLFGDVNPSGKLPITFPRHVGQMPFYYNYKPAKFNRHWRAYVTYPLTPLWEFGFGLSYTEFEYSNLQISPRTIPPDNPVNIRLDVRNIGDMAGKEVVQLYINDVISSAVTPIIELKGFKKLSLEPGEQKTVNFELTPYDLSLLNMAMERVVEPGTFDVMIGRSCKDIRLKGNFEVAD